MVHLKLTRKGIKRLITTMALIAPIVYLFGTMFTYLNGAHGELLVNDEPTSYVPKTYEEAMQVDNFSYGDWEWENEHGTRFGFSLGRFSLELEYKADFRLYGMRNGVAVTDSSSNDFNYGLGFPSYDDWLNDLNYISVAWDEYYFYELEYMFTGNGYFAFYLVPALDIEYSGVFAYVFDSQGAHLYLNDVGQGWDIVDDDYPLDDRTFHHVFFDDGANLPQGFEWNDELRSYFVPTLKTHETTSNSNYLFGQMFPHDNFLSKIGADAVSDNPHGFAPFGAMLKFVDENMLHLADTDIGLMGYGYFYYSAHVLLFVLMFDLTTFFIHFVNKLGDRFAGGMKDD